jgi:hypothetical protein
LPIYGAYYSQVGQDRFIHENYFKELKGGVFVDIGAHNGISYSNTYFFEKELNWGIKLHRKKEFTGGSSMVNFSFILSY